MYKLKTKQLKTKFLDISKKQSLLLILLLIISIIAIIEPTFWSLQNFLNIVKQMSVIGIIASGFTLVIINGDLDLSVGSLFSLVGVIVISLQPLGVYVSIIAGLAAGAFFGFINGYITTRLNLSSIIVTLGMLFVIGGLALVYTDGYNLLGDPESIYSVIAKGKILNIPNHIVIFVIIAVILVFVLKKTTFGRYIYLIGNNKEAARITGVKVKKIRILAFVISGLCVAIASIVQSSRISSASPVAGEGFEFNAVTVVLVGGTSFFGGKGSIYNTILGTLLIAVLINGMVIMNLPYAMQYMIKGILIIIAIYIDIKTRLKTEGGT
jgi:ribose/xylose/arabinose/galactoside ABC-type transport system permease subunit